MCDTPTVRKTWDVHGTMGWHVGPAMEHYRCATVCCPKTRALRISDTVALFPSHCNMPKYDLEEEWIRATDSLTNHLQNNKNNIPIPMCSNQQLEAVRKLHEILNKTPKSNPKPMHEKRKACIRNDNEPPRVDMQPPAKLPRVKITSTSKNLNNTANPTKNLPHVIPFEPDELLISRITQSSANRTPHATPFELDELPNSRITRSASKLKRYLIQNTNAVLDEDSGKILKYRHLIKNTKTRKT